MATAGPRYFISHSSHDKVLVTELAAGLGDSWVDTFEIDVGDLLLERIARGIELATDFVLVWSQHSAISRWVKFEFHMAFVRYLEDNAIRLRIVAIDDTETPLYLRPFLQYRGEADSEAIAEAVRGVAPHTPILRTFINRNREIGEIESSLYSSSRASCWIWGIPGIGKRSLVRAAMERVLADPAKSRAVQVRSGTRQHELNLLVSAALGTEGTPEGSSSADALEDALTLIQNFTEAGGVWIFEEAQHWLADDASPVPLLSDLLASPGLDHVRHLVIFTSTRQIQLDRPDLLRLRVRGLEPDFGAALLEQRGAKGTSPDLHGISTTLDGHPLALELFARDPQLDISNADSHRLRVAAEIIGSTTLADNTRNVLEVLAAVDGPLPGSDISEHLSMSADEFQLAVSEADSYGLLDESPLGYLQSHTLVREFFLRSFRRSDDSDQRLGDLADRSVRHLQSLQPGTSSYITSLTSAFRLLGLSFRIQEAFALRRDLSGVLFETAVELYQSRKYREALSYFDEVVEQSDGDLQASLYRARCLAYLKQPDEARSLIRNLVALYPDDQRVLRVAGRIEYIGEDWSEAIAYFERALKAGRRYSPLYVDLGQAKMRMGDWEGARTAVEESMSIAVGEPSAFALNLHSQILEHFGDLNAAKVAMESALRQDPLNAGYHHRLGRIAELRGDRDGARREYQACLAIDPDYTESLISLASVCADLRDFEAAHEALLKLEGMPHVRLAVLHNVGAKVALLEGNLSEAKRLVDRALEKSRDPQNIGLAARVTLRMASAGELSFASAKERVALLCLELEGADQTEEAQRLREEAAALGA